MRLKRLTKCGVVFLAVVSPLFTIFLQSQGVLQSILTLSPSQVSFQNEPMKLPCKQQSRLFISNTTDEMLDPVHGPLGCQRQQHPRTILVMAFVGDTYLDVLSVWLYWYHRLDNTDRILCLVALSQSSFIKIKNVLSINQHGIQEKTGSVILVKTETSGSLSVLWAFRVQMLHQLLHSLPSIDVIFTDLDALWLSEPQSILLPTSASGGHDNSEYNNIDIVASKATFPPQCNLLKQAEALQQLQNVGADGGTAVFGFVYFRNTPSTRKLADGMANTTGQDLRRFDDQRALNCRLHDNYELSKSTTLLDGSFRLKYELKGTRSNNNNGDNSTEIAIRLLSHGDVVRRCEKISMEQNNVTVAHCHTKKNGQSKLQSFRLHGLVPADMVMYDWEVSVDDPSTVVQG